MLALLRASAWSGKPRQKRTFPKYACENICGGELRLDEQVSVGRSDHIAQAPFPDVTATRQTCRQTSGLPRRTGGPERGRPYRSVDGSGAANPRPVCAPNRIRSGARGSETDHREFEDTPRETLAVPTARARGHMRAPFRPPPDP